MKYRTGLLIVASLMLLWGCDSKASKKAPPIDYNQTTWLEIKGFKSPGYDVSMSVGYGGEGKECKFFSFGLGKDVSRSTRMHIDANISKDDLHYTLRYPLNFKQGKCEFWAGGMEIYMEEYNHLDIKKYPKNRTIRSSKIFDDKVLVISLTYRDKIYRENFNLDPLNVYCQRDVFYMDIYDDQTDEKIPTFGAICHNTTTFRGVTGISGVRYQVDFLKAHNPLRVNLLLSEDLKCSRNCSQEEMQRAKALGVKEKMHEGRIDEKPTTNPRNTRFIPSEALFEAFKRKHKIEE